MKDEEIAALPAGHEDAPHPDRARRGRRHLQPAGRHRAVNLDADNDRRASSWARSRSGTTRRSPRNNPGVTLPDLAILVVHRSDGSGTTNAFTTYLDTVSTDWHSKVGAGKEVKWPTGIGAQGNDGVAGGVKQTAGRGRLRRAQLRDARPS